MLKSPDGMMPDNGDDSVVDGEIVDLSTCVPKTTGRSFVWTEGLFMLDPLKRPVCTCCGMKVAAGKGSSKSISNNTTNLISHYESRRLDKAHAVKLEQARSTYDPRANKGRGSPSPRGGQQQRSDGGGEARTSPPYHVADMRNAASGNPTSPVVSAERDHGAGQGGGRGNGGRQEEEEIVDLATCTPKTGGRSFVWKAELFVLDPLKRPVCTCCGIKVAAGNGNTQSNTTNLICHYESRRADKGHAEKLEHARKEYEAKGKGPATPRSHKKAAKASLRRRVFEDLLNWMILARQPLQAPEHPLLRKALQTATGDSSFDCGGQKEFREALLSKKDQATTVLREMLKGANPAVTADIWTTDSNMGFIALTVHFIQPSKIAWVMRKGTASCEVFEGSRSGAHVGAKIVDMLKKLGILQSVVSVTSDTTSNIKSGVENHTTDSIAWVGCAAHKMESTVMKCVSSPAMKASLAAFINVSVHLNKSPLSQQAFEAAQKVRFKHKAPEKVPLGYADRWWSWWGLLSVCLEHKSSLVSTIEIANDRMEGPEIVLTYDDWKNARIMAKILEPFHEAMQALEGDDITLPLLPCVMSVLNSHIDGRARGEDDDDDDHSLGGGGGGGGGTSGNLALLGRGDRWEEPPPVVKIATALSARTKSLEWLEEEERLTWRRLVLRKCRDMFRKDMAAERAAQQEASQKESPSSPSTGVVDAPAKDPPMEDNADEQPLKKQKISFLARCIETRKSSGTGGGGAEGTGLDDIAAGREEEQGRPRLSAAERAVAGTGLGAGASAGGASTGAASAAVHGNPNSSSLTLVARMRAAEDELDSFVAEQGLDPDDGGSDELDWWCKNQPAFPTLARLAVIYLAIPASAAASESVCSAAAAADNTVKTSRKQLADDTADALVFLSGSHGLAWSSGLSGEELAGDK